MDECSYYLLSLDLLFVLHFLPNESFSNVRWSILRETGHLQAEKSGICWTSLWNKDPDHLLNVYGS